MIERCTFKQNIDGVDICSIGTAFQNSKGDSIYYSTCPGEDKCILYQIYKMLNELKSDKNEHLS